MPDCVAFTWTFFAVFCVRPPVDNYTEQVLSHGCSVIMEFHSWNETTRGALNKVRVRTVHSGRPTCDKPPVKAKIDFLTKLFKKPKNLKLKKVLECLISISIFFSLFHILDSICKLFQFANLRYRHFTV